MIFLLLVALVVASGWFAWLIWPRSRPQVFYASLLVGDYNNADGLPDPAFPAHEVGSLNPILEAHDLIPWKAVESAGSATLQDANSIANAASRLKTELAKLKVTPRDTVVLQLRGNCVDFGGKAWFLAGEFSASSLRAAVGPDGLTADGAQLENALEFGKLLETIRQIPAGNIVLLADLCDLTSHPEMGLMANPVATRLEELCAADKSGDPRIWIVAAAAALQPNHVSALRKRTLLQSAVEFALNPSIRPDKSDPNRIGLDDFYESMLRYSVAATGGAKDAGSGQAKTDSQTVVSLQTPLLFRLGHAGRITRATPEVWIEARNVEMASRKGRPMRLPSQTEAGQSGDKPAETAGGDQKNTGGNPQGPGGSGQNAAGNATANGAGPGNGSAGAVPAENGAAGSAPSGTAVTAVPDDPWLQFWQLAAELESRSLEGVPDRFSPFDFGLGPWLELQAEVIRYQQLAVNPNELSAAERAVAGRVEELRALRTAIRSQVAAVGSDSSLIKAWNTFLADLEQPDGGRIAWLHPADLPDSIAARWPAARNRYRSFLDARARALQFLDAEGAGLLPAELTQRLIAGLESANPVAGNRTLMEADFPEMRVVDQAVAECQNHLRSLGEGWLKRLASTPRISWSDERLAALLLNSPCLDFPTRMAIAGRLAKLDPRQVIQPGENNAPFALERNSGDLLAGVENVPPPASVLSGMERWAVNRTGLQRALGITSPGGTQPGNRVESLNQWCRSEGYARNLRNLSGVAQLPKVTDNRGLYLEAPLSAWQLTSPTANQIDLRLRRGDGGPLGACQIRWRLLDETTGQPVPDQGERVGNRLLIQANRQAVWPDTWTPLSTIAGGVLGLAAETTVDSQTTRRFPLEIVVSNNPDDPQAGSTIRLEILPPRPDRVSLVVEPVLPGASPPQPLPVRWPAPDLTARELAEWPKDESGNPLPVCGPLKVPALGGSARSEFAFSLQNESLEEKTVQLRVYALDPPRSLSEATPGQVKTGTWAIGEENLVLVSVNPATLAGGARQPVPVKLYLPGSTDGSQPVADRSRLGQFGLVCLIEELKLVETNLLPTGRVHATTLAWQGENPYWSNLVRVVPRVGNGEIRLELMVASDAWKQYRIEKLPVEVTVTSADGTDDEIAEGVVLTPALSQAELRIRSSRGEGKRFAHLDLGGYPRAIAFSSSLGDNETAEPTQKPFAWLDLPATGFSGTAGPLEVEPLVDPSNSARIFVPLKTGVGPEPRAFGNPTGVTAMSIPFRIDLPEAEGIGTGTGRVSWRKSGQRESREQVFPVDRQQEVFWQTSENGHLLMGVAASDFRYPVAELANLSGAYEIAVVAAQGGNEQLAKGEVVIDREAPVSGRVRLVPPAGVAASEVDNRMYDDDSLTVEFSPEGREDLAPIVGVWFSLSQDSSDSYETGRPLPVDLAASFDSASGTWKTSLSGSEMDRRSPGSWRILARTVDAAGNRQDRNQPATIQWMGKRPKD